jgi:sporulation-control protein spo0M
MFVHQEVQYQLEVTGEEYIPEDTLTGSLKVKNHGTAPLSLDSLFVTLALGNIKKAKAKASDAFEPVASPELGASCELLPGREASFAFSVQLEKNCPVTEKNQSLFFVFGSQHASDARSELRVTVLRHPHVRTIHEILESSFQCVFKSEKSSDGWLCAKFNPSSSRRLSLVNEFTLKSHFEGETLELEYVFNVKQFDTSATTMNVRKGQNTVSQTLAPSDYLMAGGFLNHDSVTAKISEALSAVSTVL